MAARVRKEGLTDRVRQLVLDDPGGLMVGIYAHHHASVYGAAPTELLDAAEYRSAHAAARLLVRTLGGEPKEAERYIRWAFARERAAPRQRRLAWKLVLGRVLVGDYRLAQAKSGRSVPDPLPRESRGSTRGPERPQRREHAGSARHYFAIAMALEQSDLPSTARHVGLVLARAADGDGETYVGQRTVAERTGLSVRTVRDALAVLASADSPIELTREHRPRADGRGRTTDLYTIAPRPSGNGCRKND
jgi:hypothetical protein